MKLSFLCMSLLVLIGGSLCLGSVNLFDPSMSGSLVKDILVNLRVPRTLAAAMTGGVLGISGAVLQGFLRNPLADASLLGIGAGSALFAVIAINLGGTVCGFSTVPFSAVMGSIVTVILLYQFLRDSYSPLRLVLVGVALNSLFGALTSLALSLSENPYAIMQVLFWLFGSYADIPLTQVLLSFPFVSLGFWLLWSLGPLLDALSFGEDMAKIMGFSLKRGYLKLIGGVGLTVGISVALCGIVGFIGLVIPHIMRRFFGAKPSHIFIPSCIGGALLSLLADMIVRIVPSHIEIKVGVMTSLMGAPFFIYLLYRSYRAEI